MDSSSSFLSKMSKMENLLSVVNNEVDSVIKLLNYFKQQSSEMVEALRKIPQSSVFLKEYLEINSYLLKYLDFLTEISCKFEILQTPDQEENHVQNLTPVSCEDFQFGKSNSNISAKDDLVTLSRTSQDYASDTGNSSSVESSCEKKIPVRSRSESKKGQKGKKNLLATKKVQESLEDKHTFQLIQEESSESAVKEMSKGINSCKDGHESPPYSGTESECESFEQKSSGNENLCPPKKEILNIETSSSVKSKTFPGPVEVCDSKEIHSRLDEVQKTVKLETVKNTDSTSINMNSSNLVSPIKSEAYNDKLYEIKPIKISRRVGEEYTVILEHIVSPSEFYVYISQNQFHLFTELEEKLKEIHKDPSFNNKKRSKDYLSQVIGKYALYYSKCDEKWCRAKVTDWRVNHKDDLIYIFLLDYGESKCVILDDIQPMPDYLKSYPAFIHRCHLFGIYPTEGNLSSKTLAWSKAAREKMKCLVDTSNDLKIKIAPEDVYHPAISLPVTLWLVDQGNTCVNDLLVKSKHAQFAKKPEGLKENICESECLEKWNPMKEDFESYLNSYDLDMADPAAVIYGYVGKDYERICKHFAKTGKCFKGQSCRKEHVPLNPSGFTTDQEVIYKNAVNALPLPQPESFISVQVTCILSLNLFCCIRDESVWASEEETLQSLVQYMNSTENIRDMKKLLIPPSVGQMVIAKYSLDSSWYRGKIIESIPESDQYSVLFVDYGNKEVMPLSSIRAIEGRYLHLPFQAIQCFIFGITHNPKVSAKEGMDYLNKRMTEGHVRLKVIAAYPGDHPRLLVHVFDTNGKNIGTDLVEKKYATFKEELLVNSESTSIPG